MRLDDRKLVHEEYARDDGLAGRIAAYRFAEGPDARELLFAAIAEVAPRDVLDVGCGQGWLAERIQRELASRVVAVDQSEHMVELTRARGVDARVADAEQLPLGDGSFDCVVAAWMLYHVGDLDRALREFARVLRPRGRLVAVTNSRVHLHEPAAWIGIERPSYSFSAENGADALRRHFVGVERRSADGWIVFPGREEAQAYVASSILWRGRTLPPLEGPLRVRTSSVVFVADKA